MACSPEYTYIWNKQSTKYIKFKKTKLADFHERYFALSSVITSLESGGRYRGHFHTMHTWRYTAALGVVALVGYLRHWGPTVKSWGNQSTSAVCKRHGRPIFCWHPAPHDPDYAAFWKDHGFEVAPLTHFGWRSGDYAVFHLRCGDVLDHPHPQYRPPPVECLEQVAVVNSSQIFILGGGHGSTPRAERRCAAYLRKYTAVIRRTNPTASIKMIQSSTQKADWLLMRNSKLVVAMISSSFVMSAKASALHELRMLSFYSSDAPWWVSCAS